MSGIDTREIVGRLQRMQVFAGKCQENGAPAHAVAMLLGQLRSAILILEDIHGALGAYDPNEAEAATAAIVRPVKGD